MSLEWNNEQTHFLINERKNGNEEYHCTPNRNKRIFWEKIAEKLNEVNNLNYFTGKACNKKFLLLTRAYYSTKAYYEGTKNKRSLKKEIEGYLLFLGTQRPSSSNTTVSTTPLPTLLTVVSDGQSSSESLNPFETGSDTSSNAFY
ncbi:hypothetical protein GLOIN_2v1787822 [Rhizophagus irregularis DAOM 181602=DAOM 197198]|uniref:Uncharacterized protein n=1 Tax=Rhizophagus irregularis (strain DAOM 181602 / DAOM 197198 / MUCL 43194) TaxID=747089 RepID=A0A2P4P511_RHIID|nr:hypothetical protein GLOIN_2v1787822 [Rhizophagus irregularis DAOM 181602=DAOM 197198]POG60469.1 hypothetical protein GLOIN_2v1787822 [Rhizophagus irregularis DAOM 181602=DAOM 197198]GET52323.1 hypothetical protein GLOIN_2v1787822 [Rhizophagus irregularis DAOM 181602=DAOM 197198]|eukprot:XP_025167335.1 hypothetical protein GLOIN_2v1787822 [Rhizophagus irregularis DAOM 181602=DAOM 197198]